MANLGTMFNANAVAPATGEGQPVIAPGVYPAMMTESEPSQPNDKGNSYLKCVFEICDGPHKGVKLTHRLNLWNQTPKAVEIAAQEFSAMCHAVMDETERAAVSDSSQLHNRVMEITVAVESYEKKEKDQYGNVQYGQSNKITKFARLGSAQAGMANVQPQPSFAGQHAATANVQQQYGNQPQTQYANTTVPANEPVVPTGAPSGGFAGPTPSAAPSSGFAQPQPTAAPQQGFAAQPAKPNWAR